MKDPSELFRRLLPLNDLRIRGILIDQGVDLDSLLDAGQQDLNSVRLLTEHPFMRDIPGKEQAIRQRENLLRIVAEMIKATPSLSHAQFALYHIYLGTDLPDSVSQKQKQIYEKLRKNERERRCSGLSKRSLTTRLKDLEVILPLLKSATSEINEDITAIKYELEKRFEI